MKAKDAKKGVRVKIVKRNLDEDNDGKHGVWWNDEEMDRFIGKKATIRDVCGQYVHLGGRISIGGYIWDIDWLDVIEGESKSKMSVSWESVTRNEI